MYFCISVFATLAHAASNLKSLNREINYKKKNGPTIYSREKFQITKYPLEKVLDSRNTHEKKFWTYEIPIWTQEIPIKSRWH